MSNYATNIRLERKFSNVIKAILGLVFIGQDPIMDTKQATDFLVFNIEPIKVACRLRTYNYYINPQYRNEFTIRCKLSSGNETELDKIKKGYCDYVFYGFVNKEENKILKYFIGDLNVFRENINNVDCELKTNKDNNPTSFVVYKLSDFPSKFIIKHYE